MRRFYKNFPFAETGISLVVFSVAALLWHRNKPKDTDDKAQSVLIQYSIQCGAPVLISIMGLFANRFTENRAAALKNENDSFVHMQQLYNDGIKALTEQKFLLAEDCFRRARLIFEGKYASHDNPLATDLHAVCCYQNALALYYLKKYDESKNLIAASLQFNIQVKTVKIDLLNLSALISFKQFLSVFNNDEVADRFRKESEALFRESLRIDANQPNVALFLAYLDGNEAFLAAVQPTIFQDPSSVLAVLPQENILKSMLTFLIADVYRRQEKFAEAIFLFEDLLSVFQINPGASFDMFVIPMYCLSAYRGLLESVPRQESFDIFQNTDKGIQKISGVKKDAVKLRMEKLARIAYHFLDHAKSFDDQHAEVYRAAGTRLLLDTVNPFVSAEFSANLNSFIDGSGISRNNYASLFSQRVEAAADNTGAAPAASAG